MLTHTATIKIGKPVDQVFEYVGEGIRREPPQVGRGVRARR